MDALYRRIQWKTCQTCGEDWSKLYESGICPACDDKLVAKRQMAEKLEKMVGKYAAANFTFDAFQKLNDGHEETVRALQRFNPEVDNFYLHGPCGVGKTHLAVAVVLAQFESCGGSVAFEKPYTIQRFLRGRPREEEEDAMRILSNKKIFLLDDFGISKSTDFLLEKIYEIIDKRLQEGRNGLIITSNLTFDEINKLSGDDRLSSRINGMCRVLELRGDDFRFERKVEQYPF